MNVTDLFTTTWQAMTVKQRITVVDYLNAYNATEDHTRQGHLIAETLRCLITSKRTFKHLSSEQLVDVFEDINLLGTPPDFFLVSPKRLADTTGKLLANTTFMQFIDIDVNYIRFLITGKSQYLRLMLQAIFSYRVQTSVRLRQLPLDHVPALLYSYGAIRTQIMKMYPAFWPTPKKNTPVSKSTDSLPQKGGVPAGRGGRLVDLHATWHDTLVNLSQYPEYPGLEAAKAAPTHEALYVLNKRTAEQKKNKTP